VLAVLAVPIAAVMIYAGTCMARRPLDATLLALPTHTVDVSGVRLEVPLAWERDASGLITDRYLGIELRVTTPEGSAGPIRLGSPQADDARVRPLLERISAGARPASQPSPSPVK
jgi:hypothetical protein